MRGLASIKIVERINVAGYIISAIGALAPLGTIIWTGSISEAFAYLGVAATVVGLAVTWWSSGLKEAMLEKRYAARSLMPDKAEALTKALVSAPKGPVYVKSNLLDSEGDRFASQILKCLQAAGFPTVDGPVLNEVISISASGIWLAVANKNAVPAHLLPLCRAFAGAGVNITWRQEDYVPDENTVVIWVGHRE